MHNAAHRQPTSVTEQYLKNIYLLHKSYPEMIPMKELVQLANVAAGTVTTMVKSLHARGYLDYVPHKGCSLSKKGKLVAVKILRRHRLIELFLHTQLGYDWSEVHAEAEILEHAVSDTFINRVDALLGFPHTDPHGDPIPSETGDIPTSANILSLEHVVKGEQVRIRRIVRTSVELLNFLKQHRVLPGELFLVTDQNATTRTIELEHIESAARASFSYQVAKEIHVVREKSSKSPS